jgi:hypothetical protein
MLFAYPLPAAADNWLHDCMRGILEEVHRLVGGGSPIPAWPATVPAPHRNLLRRRHGLAARVTTYAAALATLIIDEQAIVLRTFTEQNQIATLLTCASNCSTLAALPAPIRAPATDLFDFAFDLLTDLDVRDRHYETICAALDHHVCPFCGDEGFDAPGGPREAFDHYLAKSRYPFAAANLRNLVPMGNKCNSRYKLNADILWNGTTRRPAFDPYISRNVTLNLTRSVPFAGSDGIRPRWEIDFSPNCPEVVTWDSVFRIRERYSRDILDRYYTKWIGEFAGYCSINSLRLNDPDSIINCLLNYARCMDLYGFSDRGFLRAAMFRMLHAHCSAGNARLINLISRSKL